MSQPAYVFTAAHDTVHVPSCPDIHHHAVTPWRWAQGRPVGEVRTTAAMLGLKACPTCRPLGGAA